MFKYADENQVQIYHEFCSTRLNQLKQYFSNEFNIQTKFQLIGSGSKKLVTQNNNLPFDLDYNFEILNRSIKQLDMKKLKTCVINFLNSVVYEKYEYYKKCQDSTSAITIKVVDNSGITTVANKLGGTTTTVNFNEKYSQADVESTIIPVINILTTSYI